jgi:hypothetical protein
MGKIKSALNAVGEFASAYAEHERKVTELTNLLMSKTYGADYDTTRAIATVLIRDAEITWK